MAKQPTLGDIEEAEPADGSTKSSRHDQPSTVETRESFSVANSKASKLSRGSKQSSVLVSVDPVLYNQLASRISRVSETGGDEAATVDTENSRKASLCCASCCDLPRACIIVNICVFFGLSIIMVLSLLKVPFYLTWEIYQIGDFGTVETDFDARSIVGIIRSVGAILFSMVGIVGAWKFQKYCVLSTGIWYVVYVILLISFGGRYIGIAFFVFFAYPHFHLFLELHQHKIIAENYETTEKYCCCGGSGSGSNDS